MEELKKLDEVLRDLIKPVTSPVAVKLLKAGDSVPAKVKRPTEFFGHELALCQGFGFARKYGWSMVFSVGDMACGPSLSYFGFIEIPEFEKAGELVHPMYAKTPGAGQLSEEAIDRLPRGAVEQILIAPLGRTDFEPDILMVYGNPAQMARLVQGALYCSGGALQTTVAGRCACTAEIITPLLRSTYNLVLPDGGERMFALTGDDEMVFTWPLAKCADLVEGIVTTHKSGVARYPYPAFGLRMKPQFPDKYAELVAIARQK